MSVAVVVAALAALLIGLAAGVALGWSVGRRRAVRRPPVGSAPAGPIGPVGAELGAVLASELVAVLEHGVVLLDDDERAVFVNPAAAAMGLLDGERLAAAELLALARAATETPTRRTVDLPRRQPGREPTALTVTALRRSAPTPVTMLLLTDLTEARRLEAVRRDFVANVSHELKTPVGAVMLLAEAVQGAADDPAAVQRFAGRLRHESARLGRLVQELIDLSRLDGAQELPGDDAVSVRRVLDEAADRARLAADRLGVAIATHCPDGLCVSGDEQQLTTAVANLADNAVAYSPPGTRVVLTGQTRGKHIEIAVADQGIGIAPADQARIFERFYRVDPARSRATGGTGLGLAIVKRIVANHGGTVSVWSAEGAGSTFTIRLPAVHLDAASLLSTSSADRASEPSGSAGKEKGGQ
ncbi:MAG: ATP-binding protein [Actinomycetia bacterium]|nr:ATP-binding protein [Actinomycetes bacterium]